MFKRVLDTPTKALTKTSNNVPLKRIYYILTSKLYILEILLTLEAGS